MWARQTRKQRVLIQCCVRSTERRTFSTHCLSTTWLLPTFAAALCAFLLCVIWTITTRRGVQGTTAHRVSRRPARPVPMHLPSSSSPPPPPSYIHHSLPPPPRSSIRYSSIPPAVQPIERLHLACARPARRTSAARRRPRARALRDPPACPAARCTRSPVRGVPPAEAAAAVARKSRQRWASSRCPARRERRVSM